MKTVQRHYWLFLTVTLPQAALLLIFWRIHGIIGTLLDTKETAAWIGFGLALAALCLGFTFYGQVAAARRKAVHPVAGLMVMNMRVAMRRSLALPALYPLQ